MGRKRDPEKKTRIEEIQQNLEKEQQEFMAKARPQPPEDPQEVREAFRTFWAMNKKKYNKTKDLEHILWVHMKAAGFDRSDLFEEGIEHFGLKVAGE